MTTIASGSAPGVGAHIEGYAVLALLLFGVFVGVMSIFSPRWRRIAIKAIGIPAGSLIGLYAVGRAIAEFFIINYDAPASYAKDWGGPSLPGVFAVHAGPGVAVLIGAGVWLYRRHSSRRHQRSRISPEKHAGTPTGTGAGSPRPSQMTPCA
jgi:hypothetical protein